MSVDREKGVFGDKPASVPFILPLTAYVAP